MIKSLFDEDENNEKQEKSEPKKGGGLGLFDETSPDLPEKENISTPDDVKTEDTLVETPDDKIETIEEIKTAIETGDFPSSEAAKKDTDSTDLAQSVKPFEVDKPIGHPTVDRIPENTETGIKDKPADSSRAMELEKKLRELEEELKNEREAETHRLQTRQVEKPQKDTTADVQQTEQPDQVENKSDREDQLMLWNDPDKPEEGETIQIKPKDFVPESRAETFRQTGMAWSAAIALFGSVVFMLIVGWGADLLLGTSPWGIVVGILIGSVIGFLQFFRTTSQILKPKPNDFERVSLASNITIAENTPSEEIPGDQDQENVKENIEEPADLSTDADGEEMDKQKTIENAEESGSENDENAEELRSEHEPPPADHEVSQNIEEMGEEIIELEIENFEK